MIMVKISREEYDDAMEHLHKAKKYLKKACEMMSETEESSRGRSHYSHKREHSRFHDNEEDDD